MRTNRESSRFAAKVFAAVVATVSMLAGALGHAVTNVQAYL
jgi:hypothetical protein